MCLSSKLAKLESSTEQLLRNETNHVLKAAVAFANQRVTPIFGRAVSSPDDEEDSDAEETDAFSLDDPMAIPEPQLSATTKLGRRSVRLPIAAPVAAPKPKAASKPTRTSIGIPTSFDDLLDEAVEDEDVYESSKPTAAKKPSVLIAGLSLCCVQ